MAAGIVGETKVGLTITPNNEFKFLFDQQSIAVDYADKGELVFVGGKGTSKENSPGNQDGLAVKKRETQTGVTKETKTGSYYETTTTKSTGFEVGLGVKAIL